ncbi:MBL fold metallo-hydrolase [Thermoleophilum album]|jgi:ribonuclease BN (tRNA processing enzyme)|uniref:MBL fold metallo-hydrolase n=1 Tax=Thermoleophilum album TaxID=29539 RepID=UPI00237C9C37|nr:MBL fold metallo-hydrolase [Thermoleophilum album]WDT93915.1 MBL fold metallo-hydrolase [Thermoleophilum album]
MRLTVLGKSPSWEDAGGACSGYLLEQQGHAVLLECGNGVFAKLRLYRDYRTVSAVVVSHFHGDHVLDLVPFSYALTYSPRRRPDEQRPRLLAPPRTRERLRTIASTFEDPELVERAFDIVEYAPDGEFRLGPFLFRTRSVPHFTDTFALAVSSQDQAETGSDTRFVFGADCGPSRELVEFARGASVLMLEATLIEPEAPDPGRRRGHLTPREAGEHAHAAGVERLVLTHISDEVDPAWARAEAEAAFAGEVVVAHEGLVIDLV